MHNWQRSQGIAAASEAEVHGVNDRAQLARAEAIDRARLAKQLLEAGVTLADSTGYGRIVRDGEGAVARIVEHKDASAAERALPELNTGLMAAPAKDLKRWLGLLRNDNAQG